MDDRTSRAFASQSVGADREGWQNHVMQRAGKVREGFPEISLE